MNKVNEVQVSYQKKPTGIFISGAQDAADVLREGWDDIEYFETFKVLMVTRASEVLGIRTISSGGTAGTVVDAKLVFQVALACNASSIILCHNHPSGNLKPSRPDIELTKKLAEGGKLLDILVLDHIILTNDSYTSLSQEGHF